MHTDFPLVALKIGIGSDSTIRWGLLKAKVQPPPDKVSDVVFFIIDMQHSLALLHAMLSLVLMVFMHV